MTAYEFTVSADLLFYLQYLYSQGIDDNLGTTEDVSHKIQLGYK